MTTTLSAVNDLFALAEPLLGRTPDDAELQSLLVALGKSPAPQFGPEDVSLSMEDEPRGFCLSFQDAETVKHPAAVGKAARTPIFVACFFFNEGVENYHAFKGVLPAGITWADTSTTLVARLGPPKNEIMNKKTGVLSSHRWPLGSLLLTARYGGGGSAINHIYVGIK